METKTRLVYTRGVGITLKDVLSSMSVSRTIKLVEFKACIFHKDLFEECLKYQTLEYSSEYLLNNLDCENYNVISINPINNNYYYIKIEVIKKRGL